MDFETKVAVLALMAMKSIPTEIKFKDDLVREMIARIATMPMKLGNQVGAENRILTKKEVSYCLANSCSDSQKTAIRHSA